MLRLTSSLASNEILFVCQVYISLRIIGTKYVKKNVRTPFVFSRTLNEKVFQYCVCLVFNIQKILFCFSHNNELTSNSSNL